MHRDDKKSFMADHRDEVFRCVKCGACHAVCPTYQATGDEASAARGRLSLLEAVLDERLGMTRGLDERIFSCAGCMACEDVCPSGIRVHDLILAARRELAGGRHSHRVARLAVRGAARGSGGPHALARLAATAGEAAYNRLPDNRLAPWWRPDGKRLLPPVPRRSLADIIGEATPSPGASRRYVLFPGCATSAAFPQTGVAAVRLLAAAGADLVHPRSFQCCGLPFLSLGDYETAREAAEANLALLKEARADSIITVCSSCALMLREKLPRLLGREREDVAAVAASVKDIHEVLARDGLPSRYSSGPDATVTWHDPCHMRHGLGLTDMGRDVVSSLGGIRYVDTEPGCCGGAGAFSFTNYDLSLKIGRSRAEEIAAGEADIVATGCPGCRAHLADTLRRAGSSARVVHTVELVTGDMYSSGRP